MGVAPSLDQDRSVLQYEYVCLLAEYQDIERFEAAGDVDIEKVFRIVTRMQQIERLLRQPPSP